MKISSGVEWAAHACALLAALPPGKGLRAEALAAFHDLPPAYLAKQMQALSKAGLVNTNRGAKGGYRLARPVETISMWDITAAIDGTAPAFRCSEIRQAGPCKSAPKDCKKACPIARSFHHAETAYRDALKKVSLTMICADVAKDYTNEKAMRFGKWLTQEMTDL